MSSLIEVLDAQRRPAEVVGPNGTVLEAIAKMARSQIGCLVVTEDDQVVGLLTERDYLQKVVLRGRTSRTTLVREVMTTPVVVGDAMDDAAACLKRLLSHRVKYLPVVEADRLVGVLSRGDLMRQQMHQSAPVQERASTGRYAIVASEEVAEDLLRTAG